MSAVPGEHAWSQDALFNKALIYVQKMESYNADDWEYGFWSSLSLEFLCRAAVAHISPTLLAADNWRNRHYALGNLPTTTKFVPRSVETKVVLEIIAELVPGFAEVKDFCVQHTERRNAELHSGDLEFKNLETGKWLPKYYATCKVLLEFIGKELDDFVEEPATAEQLIAASQDEAAKVVQRDIASYKKLWIEKSSGDKDVASSRSQLWSSREIGHRAKCPACENPGLLRGVPQGSVATNVREDEIIQKQTVVPSSFECIACGLKVVGLSKLVACELGSTFTATSISSPAEFFGLYTEDDLAEARASGPDFEDDYNE
jgi:hypothetical protein